MALKEKPLVNRVAKSGLITINLEFYFPDDEIVGFDLKGLLFKGLILKEKEFRSHLSEIDWAEYKDKVLAAFCSADAIIPVWAYMLIAVQAQPFCKRVFFGTPTMYLESYYSQVIESMEVEPYRDKKIVIKGCSDVAVPTSAYMDITRKLRPIASSIMYGEPCSTVPIYKRPRKKSAD